MKYKQTYTTPIISIIIFASLFAYIALRAYFIPLVHDEAATYFYYIQSGIYLPPEAHLAANNHILNSALSHFSYLLFGSSEFAIRLANVLSFPVFLLFLYKISRNIENTYLQWFFILSLALAHNFIEYFALSRGYGLSLAFLMASIYYLFQALNNKALYPYPASLIFLTLSLFANLTLLTTALIVFTILSLNLILKYRSMGLRNSLFNLLTLVLFISFPIRYVVTLLIDFKQRGLLYYGELDGFWETSVKSLLKLLSGSQNYIFELGLIFLLLLLLALLITNLRRISKLKELIDTQYLFVILLLGNLLAVFFLGYFMGINFPEDRTGIYFFPLFIGSIIFLLDRLKLKTIYTVIVLLPLLFFPLHFVRHLNLSYSSFWKNEHIPKRFVEQVKKTSTNQKYPATVGGYEMRRLCWAYDNMRLGGELNQIQSASFPEIISDYQVVELQQNSDWEQYYYRIDYDSISKLSLLKRKQNLSKDTIYSFISDSLTHTNTEFFGFYSAPIENTEKQSIIIKTRFLFNTLVASPSASLVASISDKKGKTLKYEFIKLSWKSPNWDNRIFRGIITLADVPKEARHISIYLWNRKKENFDISNIEFEVFRVGL